MMLLDWGWRAILGAYVLGAWVCYALIWDLTRRRVPITVTAAGALLIATGVMVGAWSWSPVAGGCTFLALSIACMGWGDRWAGLLLGGLVTWPAAALGLSILLAGMLGVHVWRPILWARVREWPAIPFVIGALMLGRLVWGPR